jgi:hypothetical protein
MASPITAITPDELLALAFQYCDECIAYRKEQNTASGRIVLIKERQIPTISYFLQFWIPKIGIKPISRATYYNWLNGSNMSKLDTIKRIEGLFNSLTIDIIANEGKGIFYAKNKLGMSDKASVQNSNINSITIKYE